MKKLLILSLFSMAVFSAFGTIWHVNNNPGMVADFADINTALNSASVVPGDTLYVYGSPTTYAGGGTIQIYKRLTIIGPGYFLSQNPGLQNNLTTATFSEVAFREGSEGSLITGINFIHYVQTDVANVVIQRNKMQQAFINAANCMLLQNYIYPTPDYTYSIYVSGGNTTIGNNYIYRSNGGWCLYMEDSAGGSFYNNITGGSCRFRNCDVYNNIVHYNAEGWTLSFTWDANSYIHHNVLTQIYSWDWYITVPAMGEGNLYNVTDQVYVLAGSDDGWYRLCAGSPAIGAGFNGADCGIFGGSNPYKLSGIPAIPTISEFIAPATGFTIPIQITARSNN